MPSHMTSHKSMACKDISFLTEMGDNNSWEKNREDNIQRNS